MHANSSDAVHIATCGDSGRQSSPGAAIPANNAKSGDMVTKNSVYQKIINLIPPHRVYIEAFAGSGAILRHKRPALANIAIDADTPALEQLRSDIAKNGVGAVDFINANAIAWLAVYPFQGDEFVYADPPYLFSTRRQHRPIYRCELAEEDHIILLGVLKRLPCPVMISGYWSELYAQALADWHISTFEAITRGGAKATEYLWMNYPTPIRLHDYSHLGDTFRDRERIKRKKQRWVSRLQKMDILERQALLSAIEDPAIFGDTAPQCTLRKRDKPASHT